MTEQEFLAQPHFDGSFRERGAAMDREPARAAIDAMRDTFIRAAEIWVPSKDRRRLEFGAGLYGNLTELETVSRETVFDYDEGLPGKAWAAGHPIILRNLTNSYFKRGDAARIAGLTCGVALPIFVGSFPTAVIVLLCGDDREHVGAIELWNSPPGLIEMSLVDGYYGTAEVFEWNSRRTNFMKGHGLPGRVWQCGMPVILEDLGNSRRFLRWESAVRVGINRGLGIPCGRDAEGTWVLTLLSALGTPISRRVECWVPDADRGGLTFHSGYCETKSNLAADYAGAVLREAEGTLGHVWRTAIPDISTDLANEPDVIAASADGIGLGAMVAIPIIIQSELRAIVACYL